MFCTIPSNGHTSLSTSLVNERLLSFADQKVITVSVFRHEESTRAGGIGHPSVCAVSSGNVYAFSYLLYLCVHVFFVHGRALCMHVSVIV